MPDLTGAAAEAARRQTPASGAPARPSARPARRLAAALALCLCGWDAPAAQELNAGGFVDFDGRGAGVPVLHFLKLPPSARGVGMGTSGYTTDEEATMVQGNPSLLALVEDYYYAISHTEILGEFRHENLAFTYPTQAYGNFGGSARILAATAFEDARDIDEERSAPSAYDMALGLSYGKTIWEEHVSAGARLDFIHSNVDDAAANGYALTAGAVFMLVSDLRLALMYNNLSHGITYDDHSGAPSEPLPMSFGIELGKPLLDTRWSGHVGALQGNDGITRFYLGAEWRMIKYLLVRAGYNGSTQDRELGPWSGISTGLGVKYDRITLDYGYQSMGPIGDYHSFSLSYSRKSKFRPRDEIYMERAQKKFREGNYRRALSLARSAVIVNPYNFKAQAMVQKALLELDRLNEMAVTLAYTANTDGRLASEWRDGRPVGGLPRRKTRLLELKGSGGKTLILDAGNLTNPASKADKERYVYGAYAQMPYDAVNMGAAEVRLGAERWDSRLPFMASQHPLDGIHPVITEKTLKLKGGAEVLVLGAVDGQAARAGALGGKELEAAADAVRRKAGEARGNRIVVLLLHGSLIGARQVAAKVPQLDVIILSGEATALGSPMKMGKTLICSPGKGGTHLGELTLQLDKAGQLRSFRHSLVPLDAAIPEDAALKKFLEPVTVDPNKVALDDWDDDHKAQVLAWINAEAPGRGGRLFLRDLRSGNDYRIAAPGLLASRPMLGYGKNKVAFQGEDGSGAREIYAFEPGLNRLDTLTALGGRAGDMRWILRNNALLAAYEKGGKSELYRIDPWSREVRDLTKGRFGDVTGFDVTRAGDRLALNGRDGQGATIWVTNNELESPVPIASDKAFPGSPRWNPAGDRLAFLTADSAGGAELRVFDFGTKTLINATAQSRVRDFAWSADGKRIYYSAGVNLADVNAFHLDSMSLAKATSGAAAPRSEEGPAPKLLGERDGLLFEAASGSGRNLLWMDLKTREERVIADSLGYNSLR